MADSVDGTSGLARACGLESPNLDAEGAEIAALFELSFKRFLDGAAGTSAASELSPAPAMRSGRPPYLCVYNCTEYYSGVGNLQPRTRKQ